jgi:hypothetical protein
MRFIDGLDMWDVILRTVLRPDASLRQEIYRIRRVGEQEGRMRFTVADVELEARQ